MGTLKVLNWAGFKAALSYNFDDTNTSQMAHYNPSGGGGLNSLGVHYTFYLWANKLASYNLSTTWDVVLKDGNEFGNHTNDHTNVTLANVQQGQSTIESTFSGVKVHTFAAPNGDTGYEPFAQQQNYLLDRGVGDGLMMPGNDTSPSQWNVHCFIPATSAPPSAFESEIDGARSGGGWRVILVHGFNGGTDGAYQPVNYADYATQVQYAKTFPDLWIDTMVNVGSYWIGQIAFNAATKTTSGSSTTYTWKLPTNFPTGHYLRVTTGTGGTLTQEGKTLAWDTHGYYEVSLDAGSLTFGP
jgi:hypothetical protein